MQAAFENMRVTLVNGFTTIQSPGAATDAALRDSVASGRVPGPRILTAVRVQVGECFKGKSQRSGIVTLTQLGGALDGITMDYSGRPTFRVGETVVLFARPNQHNDLLVVGLKQGKLVVRGNEVQRELSGVSFIDADLSASPKRNPARKLVQARYTLDELRDRLARVR